jgi:hypothetical protein
MVMSHENETHLIHQEIQLLNRKLDRVLLTLIGDDEMMQEGLVKKVERHERYIQNQKLQVAKFTGIATGMGIVGGFIVELLMKLL